MSNYKFNINGKNRIITKRHIKEDNETTFLAYYYYGYCINITYDEDRADYGKPWYATCINSEVYFGTAVDGWVGETKEDAIRVCLENIFYTP